MLSGGRVSPEEKLSYYVALSKFLQDPMSARAISEGVVFSEEEGAALMLSTITL